MRKRRRRGRRKRRVPTHQQQNQRSQRFWRVWQALYSGSVEDLSGYEEEETEGMMAKAVVIHGVPTNWRINGVADFAGRIMGEVIGVR